MKTAARTLIASLLVVGACAPGVEDDFGGVDAAAVSDPDATGDRDGDQVINADDNCPDLSNPGQTDYDGDLVGDSCDCDPESRVVNAVVIADDRLDSDRGLFEPAGGFPPASWSHDGSALVQSRLEDEAADAAFLVHDRPLRDVRVEVTAASTEIADFDTSDLRQNLIVARAAASADVFTAVGCGIEVVEGLQPTQMTSALVHGGQPGAVTVSVEQRVARAAVVENEEYTITLDLRDNTLECTVTLDGTDVSVARSDNIAAGAGAVGLFTRESRARFHSIRVCEYR
jgi:hypothetical protein